MTTIGAGREWRVIPFPIHTERLVLRRFEEGDLPAFVSYRSDPEIARYQSWSTFDERDAEEFFAVQQRTEFGSPGRWFQIAIVERSRGAMIGDVGICVRDDDPVSAEIGFTVSRAGQGRGLAREAVARVCELIFETTPAERIESITDTRNLACLRLLSRIGMQPGEIVEAMFKEEPCEEQTFVMSRQ